MVESIWQYEDGACQGRYVGVLSFVTVGLLEGKVLTKSESDSVKVGTFKNQLFYGEYCHSNMGTYRKCRRGTMHVFL